MPLLDADTPEEEFEILDEMSAHFLRAIKQHYTRDTAVDVMEALAPILGKDWKGRLIFGIMANKYQTIKSIRIRRNVLVDDVKKINAIKEVRAISGMGLVEAKNAVEDAYSQSVTIKISETPSYGEHTDWNKSVQNSIAILRSSGFTAEIA